MFLSTVNFYTFCFFVYFSYNMDSLSGDRRNLINFLFEAELQQYHRLFRDVLKVSNLSQLKYVMIEDLVQIGLSKPEQRRYKKMYSKYFPNPYLSRIKKFLGTTKKQDQFPPGQNPGPSGALHMLSSDKFVKLPTKHIISIDDITINKELGMGQFGVVQQGTWNTGTHRLQVAIKCLGQERMTSNSTEFLKEAAVMHSIDHPSIVRLYGVVLHMDSLMLVTELAPLRSLLECLREASLRDSFPVPSLCDFAEQICDGMAYLENKRLIHRDLAARNILVFNKDTVKISDFGLSRALGAGKDYYQTNYNVNLKLPVAWCAPECILYLRFTSASDMWAYGVCLWEMFTYGFQPWAAFSGQQILETIDAPNFQRLEKPDCCPEAYYATMLECWAHDPSNRPRFRELRNKLRTIRPDMVQTTVDFQSTEEGRRTNLLEYKAGDIITVLGRENITKTALWYGVLPSGACGMFDPSKTKPYVRSEPRKQLVNPYRASKDLDEVPLLNPNSPSHLSVASCTPPYPLLSPNRVLTRLEFEEVELPMRPRPKSPKPVKRLPPEPSTSKIILNKVKSATLGRVHKGNGEGALSKNDEVHEYHEISDTDTEGNVAEACAQASAEAAANPESPGFVRNVAGKHGDSDSGAKSQTLNKSEKKKAHQTGTMRMMSTHEEKTLDAAVALANELTTKSMTDLEEQKLPNSPSSKFQFKFPLVSLHHSGNEKETEKESTGKPERRNFSEEANSVPDIQATFTEESKMAYTSLIEEPTPSTSLMSQIAQDAGGILMPGDLAGSSTGAIPKATGTLPKPTGAIPKSTGAIPKSTGAIPKSTGAIPKSTGAIPKATRGIPKSPRPVPKVSPFQPRRGGNPNLGLSPPKPFDLLELPTLHKFRSPFLNGLDLHGYRRDPVNVLPLPPRTNKPKLIEKPRHVRKHPLKMPIKPPAPDPDPDPDQPAIYQNAIPKPKSWPQTPTKAKSDGDEPDQNDTNPFTGEPGTGWAKFDSPSPPENVDAANDPGENSCDTDEEYNERLERLIKDCTDHVSVEDLLEFADQKPCGRQRGVESDEVRIMTKVLKKQQVGPEQCLEALEICEWNVHLAIKVIRVKLMTGADVTMESCRSQLEQAAGDTAKAAASLVNPNGPSL